MFRPMQWAGMAVVVTLLAACGGGDEASGDAGSKLASAKFAVVDAARCQEPKAPYHQAGGLCIERFGGMELTPLPAQRQGATKSRAAQAPQQPYTVPTMAALFTWAASAYPQFFYGGSQDGSISMPGFGLFQYRYFNSGNYMAVLGSEVYLYGWVSNYTIMHVGSLSDFSCTVYSCGGGGGSGGGSTLTPGSYVAGATYSAYATVQHSIYLTAGVTYTFDLSSSAADPYLELYYGSSLLKENDDISYPSNTNSRIVYAPTVSGTYVLDVSFYGSGYGSYTLSASSSGGGTGGGGTGGGGTGGTINWSSAFSADEIVETSQTLAVNGRWGQGFTVSNASLPVEIIFAAQYQANLYVTTGASLNACVNGGAFSHYDDYQFVGQFGHQSFSLPPGSYGICVQNASNAPNAMRVEFQNQPSVAGFHYSGQRFDTVVETVQPGGRFVQQVTVGDNYRVIIDGANSGGEWHYIPADQQSAFLNGSGYQYYDDDAQGGFHCSSGQPAPGLCEMTGIGVYAIAYENNTSSPQTIVITGRDYVPD